MNGREMNEEIGDSTNVAYSIYIGIKITSQKFKVRA